MKSVKKLLGVFVFIACTLFLVPNNVDAKEINSEETLIEAFEGYSATVEGTTVTLTGNVDFTGDDDVFEVDEEEYIFNLNGYSIKLSEFYLNGGSLIINDTTGTGKLDAIFTNFGEGTTVVINNGRFGSLIDNWGTLTINNGEFHSIWNSGTLTINDGKFANVAQNEGKLYINGGLFTSYKFTEELEDGTTGEFDYFSLFYTDSEIVMTGGKFVADGIDTALQIYGANENDVNERSINLLAGEGYIAKYEVNKSTSWDVSYKYVEIVEDESERIINEIAPNGVWTINGSKPTDMEDSEFLLTSIADDLELPKGYKVYAYAKSTEEFNPEKVILIVEYEGHYLKEVEVKALYNEPSTEIKSNVKSVLDKVATKFNGNFDVETGFLLEDLYLINYLNASTTGMDSSLALNFSKDLIALTNGSNISYKYDSRLGDSTPTELWGFSGGRVIVYYDGIAVGTTRIGLTTNHVLYIPDNTLDTDDARIEAALKRIKEYLGTTDGIKIEVGGTLESLNEDGYTWKDHGFIDEKTSGTNYYNKWRNL